MVMYESGPVDHQRGDLSRDDGSRPAVTVLTSREVELMRYRALGVSIKGASMSLGVSLSTAKRMLRDIHDKLGATCDEDIYRDLGWLVVPNG